ncbi:MULTISPECIES: DUF2336 domain-containing protein [unclassified Aminobacter]|uniref:DUF2336 domain-containing protein n=1 Tax=unclassified Aminobacter TaxID=2644704 RepID=UPI00046749A7|nr:MULTISPECIES: DUF2336 domain-containing protein [unclassified Aminobacter]TWH31929.1 uncharacterized protein (DUF2336 family) [Aminobacter sp. J15]
MVVRQFLQWLNSARVSERAAAAAALARAFVEHELPFEDRCAAEAAMTLLLDDPSPKVRAALSEALSMSRNAPIQVVSALASDQPEVSQYVLVRSPLLTDLDLIDRVAISSGTLQALIASRPVVSMGVAAAIAEVGEVEACAALLQNGGAQIASLSFRRIAERHGEDARLRELLLADPRLPGDCRHLLLMFVGAALSKSPLVLALMGQARAERVTRDACTRASLMVIDRTDPAEHEALIGHLRLRGDLTPGFLVRVVAHGKIDFLGSVLIELSGFPETRVRALLASGRDVAVAALFRACGLADNFANVFVHALKTWRKVAKGECVAGAQEVSWLMLKYLGAAPGQPGPAEEDRELAALIKAIHLDVLRENARTHALEIAAA